jgi:hypothetical protein
MANRQDESPRRVDQPEPGFYILRYVRGGPWVGAEIRHLTDGWMVHINGDWQGPSADPWMLSNMEKVHIGGKRVLEDEVKFRIGLARWAQIYAPDHEAANPRREINLDRRLPY